MIRIEVNSQRFIAVLFFVLVGAEVLLVLADAFINVGRLSELGPVRRFFNITREDGLATWFSVTQTWTLGLTATFLYAVVAASDAMRWRRVGWAIIAAFLLYMAMDDGAEFHERIGSSVKAMLQGENAGSGRTGFFPSYTWQLVFLPIFGAFGLFMLWFFNRELRVFRDKLFVLAAITLLVLAVIADFIEGLAPYHPLNLHRWIHDAWDIEMYTIRHYFKSAEEFMEMLSMTLLWVVFLRHLVRIAPEIQLLLRKDPG